LGPAGQTLRRFVDTNGDNVVDQWRYFHQGIEVYRDLDTDFNNKVDQSRWVNVGGSRWGIDQNEDGQVDRWKQLSAEEVTRVGVQALVTHDSRLFQTLLITQADLTQLSVDKPLADKLLSAVRDSDRKLRDVLTKSRTINQQTKWMRFDGVMPGVIPADSGKAGKELVVYENAMAIVETSGQTGLIQFGEILRVGDVWKLTQIPQPLEGTSVPVTLGGPLMRPAFQSNTGAVSSNVSPATERVLRQLQALDQKAPPQNADRATVAQYVSQRTTLLSQLVSLSKTPKEKSQWTRQLIDGLASAAQARVLPDAIERLASLEAQFRRTSAQSELVPYVAYRRLMAAYTANVQTSDAKQQQQAQKKWLAELKKYVQTYPRSEDTADAMLQLAVSYEFGGQSDEARSWYRRAAGTFGNTPAGTQARGALQRLDLPGKPLVLSGPALGGGTADVAQYRGKVLLVLFWATWCAPCTDDLPQLRALHAQYRDRGFDVLGINLDTDEKQIQPYLAKHGVTWRQVFQQGGLASPIAQSLGIVSLPTMFLVDAQGKVISSNVTVSDLKTRLAEMFKK